MRPIDKRFFRNAVTGEKNTYDFNDTLANDDSPENGGSAKLQVSGAYFNASSSSTDAAALHIVEQKNPTVFKVNNGASGNSLREEFLTLTGVDAHGDLAKGQFHINALKSDSSAVPVVKFYRNVVVVKEGDNLKRYKWIVSDTAPSSEDTVAVNAA